MDTQTIKFLDEMTPEEFKQFLQEGIDDLKKGNVLDFDEVFDELEKRYIAYD